MPVLDCSVRTCFYNKENQCCLEGIKVEGTSAQMSRATACGSFREKEGDCVSNSCTCGSGPSARTQIDCMASQCTFNDHQTCNASRVNISGCNAKCCEDTECDSFVRN